MDGQAIAGSPNLALPVHVCLGRKGELGNDVDVEIGRGRKLVLLGEGGGERLGAQVRVSLGMGGDADAPDCVLLEVGPQIHDVLDPDPEANQRQPGSRPHSCLAGLAARPFHECLDASQASRIGDHVGRAADRFAASAPATTLKESITPL